MADVLDHARQSPLAPKPDHIADQFVYDYDAFSDPEFHLDQFGKVQRILQDAPPVFWTPRNGGHWIMASHAAVTKANTDWETYSNVLIPPDILATMTAQLPPGTITPANALPSGADGPEHTKYRAPLNPAFTPKVVAAKSEEIRALAAELIERVRPNGKCEIINDISAVLPVQMFLKMWGLPVEKHNEYRVLVDSITGGSSHDFGKMIQSAMMLIGVFNDELVEHRDNPRDDIISMMWKLEIGGEPMTLELMQSYGLALFLAGLETVRNAMALGARHLAMNPDLQAQVRADPSLIPRMSEELLRLYSFAAPPRVCARDHVIEGATMRAGERIMLLLACANRDPRHFDQPNEFRMDREDGRLHLAFGSGAHRCLGMHLARLEMQIYYEELLSRLPSFRLDPDHPTTYHGGHTSGPDNVNLLWDV
jgi:cytochrome P450